MSCALPVTPRSRTQALSLRPQQWVIQRFRLPEYEGNPIWVYSTVGTTANATMDKGENSQHHLPSITPATQQRATNIKGDDAAAAAAMQQQQQRCARRRAMPSRRWLIGCSIGEGEIGIVWVPGEVLSYG